MKNLFIVISICFLLISINVSSLPNSSILFDTDFKVTNYIYVNNSNYDGPWDGSDEYPFFYIQDAINASNSYDIIIVEYGIYFEKIRIDKPLEINGINYPVIDGNYNESIMNILHNDVLINGITFCNSGGFSNDAAIQLIHVKNLNINDCIFYNLKNGIKQSNSENVFIINCSFLNNGNGIYIENNDFTCIKQCYFSKNSISIFGSNINEIYIEYSSFRGNGFSSYFKKSSNIYFDYCNLSDNSINKGGLFFDEISNIKINQSMFNHNGDSISISNCKDISIKNSTFTNNTHYAISMRNPSNNVIINNCIISNNKRTAIYIEKGNVCKITNCNIEKNNLYSIDANEAYCNVVNNWWGSILGPYSLYFLIKNKITYIGSKIIVHPWEKEFINSIGVNQDLITNQLNHPEINNEKIYSIVGIDTDGDIAPDWWEEKWNYSVFEIDDHKNLDPDMDGLNNLEECITDEYGSNPFYKDIFLEIDWMICSDNDDNKPSQKYINQIIQEFANHDIVLHIDTGNLGGGEEVPGYCNETMGYEELQDIYWKYFLNNNLKNIRKEIFHYGLICNYCPDLNFPFTGWNSLDSFAVSVQWLMQNHPYLNREKIIAGGIMHHLGHTLGLTADTYEGIDNIDTLKPLSYRFFKYIGYVSSMNYLYKFKVLSYSDGNNSLNNFNDWENINLRFFKDSNY